MYGNLHWGHALLLEGLRQWQHVWPQFWRGMQQHEGERCKSAQGLGLIKGSSTGLTRAHREEAVPR